MSFRDIKLGIAIEIAAGCSQLHFIHLGLAKETMCTVITPLEGHLVEEPVPPISNPANWLCRVFFGVKTIEPMFQLRSTARNHHSICFYQCWDRRRNRKVFGFADNGSDGGGNFVTSRENFEEVYEVIENLRQRLRNEG